jgi:hypothetical protein
MLKRHQGFKYIIIFPYFLVLGGAGEEQRVQEKEVQGQVHDFRIG